jgi:protein farnesyltransferase/geranylgeranyltransferase type-1 subunit alpha
MNRSSADDLGHFPKPDLLNDRAPLGVIMGSNALEVASRFYSLLEHDIISDHSLEYSEKMIELNSASYTAWVFRRKCLVALKTPRWLIENELAFVDEWCNRNSKNYQVWYHRRWIFETVFIKDHLLAREALPHELEKLFELLEVEPKHYNAWSHRIFIATRFGLFETSSEFDLTDRLIQTDIRNNSAWNHRRHALTFAKHRSPEEIVYVTAKLRLVPGNESAWIYLRSLDGWSAHPEVTALFEELTIGGDLHSVISRETLESFAVKQALQGLHADAQRTLEVLLGTDFIRQNALKWKTGNLGKSNTLFPLHR